MYICNIRKQKKKHRMPDGMSEYISDRMQNIRSEYVSNGISLGGDHSENVCFYMCSCISSHTFAQLILSQSHFISSGQALQLGEIPRTWSSEHLESTASIGSAWHDLNDS